MAAIQYCSLEENIERCRVLARHRRLSRVIARQRRARQRQQTRSRMMMMVRGKGSSAERVLAVCTEMDFEPYSAQVNERGLNYE